MNDSTPKQVEALESAPEHYSAWCHECSDDFVYYSTDMDKPDYDCPKCKSNIYVTVP